MNASSPATMGHRSPILRQRFLRTVLGLLTACLTQASAASPPLSEILNHMEVAGKKISNFSTAITQKKWTAVLKEFDTQQKGSLWYLRTKSGEAFLRKDITSPENNILVVAGGEALFYEPKIKQARKYQLGANKDKAEFLVLGFGSSARSLTETYEIKLLGEESIDGRKTYMLELKPKSSKAAAYFSQIVLWVAEQIWLPVQQKLVEPNGDYMLIQFKELKLNPGVARSRFKVSLPAGVQTG